MGQRGPVPNRSEDRPARGTRVYAERMASHGGSYIGQTEQKVVVQPWNIPGVKVVGSRPLGN